MTILYKILRQAEWAAFKSEGTFTGSSVDKKDNFIHLALEHQYPAILDKFFKDTKEVVLVGIDSSKLPEDALKIEANKPGGEKFPHFYGSLPLESVSSQEVLELPLVSKSFSP